MASEQLTQILHRAQAGDSKATGELLPIVYAELRSLAERQMRTERAGHTLQPTALVNEAYLRLLGENPGKWTGMAHFFHAAARAMRQLLIEHARGKSALKRGGDRRTPAARLTIADLADLADKADAEDILALDEAIESLAQRDPEVAAVVRLRFFAGLTVDQTANVLGISPRQVDRFWTFARATLFQSLSGEPSPESTNADLPPPHG